MKKLITILSCAAFAGAMYAQDTTNSVIPGSIGLANNPSNLTPNADARTRVEGRTIVPGRSTDTGSVAADRMYRDNARNAEIRAREQMNRIEGRSQSDMQQFRDNIRNDTQNFRDEARRDAQDIRNRAQSDMDRASDRTRTEIDRMRDRSNFQ